MNRVNTLAGSFGVGHQSSFPYVAEQTTTRVKQQRGNNETRGDSNLTFQVPLLHGTTVPCLRFKDPADYANVTERTGRRKTPNNTTRSKRFSNNELGMRVSLSNYFLP